MNKVDDFVSRWGTQKYLAFSLFCYLIADAFTPDNLILLYSIMAMLIVSGPMATGRNGRERLLTIVLSLVMIGLGYAAIFTGDTETRFAAHIIAALFFGNLIYLISRALLMEQTRITAETLWAAVNVYVLFGMMFAFLYSAVLILDLGAFSGGILDNGHLRLTQSMIYYSIVTMTTLGYGDIVPKIHVAATLAYVQALIGQLYVAILIARLVSMYNIGKEEGHE